MAPDTSGDGTGCDNMTCLIVLLNQVNTRKYFANVDKIKESADFVNSGRYKIKYL